MTSYIIDIIRNLRGPRRAGSLPLRFLATAAVVFWVVAALAHDPAKYAASSALASGKWGKVNVSQTGIQFVSAATLRKLGFNDPTKVNVYGFGGRTLPDQLLDSDSDDLPILPSVKSSSGIWFFGHNHIRWTPTQDRMQYAHDMQPYAEESWYFLSDRDAGAPSLSAAYIPESASDEISSFTQMLLHEQETYHPQPTGRIYLGEDLRANSERKINFTLTDKADDDFMFRISAVARTLSTSTITVTPPSGEPSKFYIESSKAHDSDDFNNEVYFRTNNYGNSIGSGSTASENLTLGISHEASGSNRLAYLDYVELAYSRRIALRDGQIYFPLNLDRPGHVSVSGAAAGLRIWDVTDHTRPLEVTYTLSGSTADFISPSGFHEYVAFIPEKNGYEVTDPTPIGNQDLHSLNTPDMLIISPHEYLNAANTLAAHHREHDGMTVHVIEPELIYNEFSSGTPDAGAFRRLLKMWYDRGTLPAPDNGQPSGRIGYCLIMSRPTYDNKMKLESTRGAGYPRIPIWQSPESSTTGESYPCDDFIGMLDDGSPTSQFKMDNQKIRVAVGRMPVTSSSEAASVVKKYIDYVTTPSTGAWRNRMLMLADDGDRCQHMEQMDNLYKNVVASKDGNRMDCERLYLGSYERVMSQTGPTVPAAKERLLRLWNDGINVIYYIGHASTVEWTHEKLLEWTDIQNFRNKNLPLLYAATCEFARHDDDTRSGAEVLWSNPEGGLISMICPTRSVYIIYNDKISSDIGRYFFDDSNTGLGRRIGDIMIDAKNEAPKTNNLRFTIIGDPAMRIKIPRNIAEVTEIAGNEVTRDVDEEELPVLQARSRSEIKGVIRTPEGEVDNSFNGKIEIILYDAEKAVETNIDPTYQKDTFIYNTHATTLYRGIAKVEGGLWSTSLIIPEEIENLTSKARVSLYAYTDEGTEAHGSFENFYIYGYDNNAPDDNEGPKIHYFAMNREDFADGGLVHSSPVAMAKFSDESGINISSLGIGHQITLTLDGRTYFDDVNTYYTPDAEDFTAGSIAYPLPELPVGEHTLRLTVWDNANNSASADLKFYVAAAKQPEIFDLRTDVNPARDNVNFTLSTDRPMANVECRIEVFDLNGRRVWISDRNASTDVMASITVPWDLCTSAGARVPRGIYLYRATVTSPDGTSATRTRKLAVAAQ